MMPNKIMLGAIGLMGIIILFLWHKNGQLREDLGAQKQALTQAAAANKTNVENFDRVNADLTACVDQVAVDKAANETTIANLEARYARLEIRKDRVQIRREEIFRDPNCAELRDLDMAAICPDWADELRIRATTLGGDGDSRGVEGSERTTAR